MEANKNIQNKIDLMNYSEEARQARLKVLELVHKAGTSHIGSNFSCIDILTVLFDKIDLNKDKFILSAGWKAASLYYFLWKKGKITDEELNSFCIGDSKFIGLCEPVIPEIIFAGGSVGMGLSAGVALAWSKKQRKQDGRIYVLESDGGMQPGINWEALWFADQHKLNNITLVIDNNSFQAMGKTDDILSMEKIREKLKSFGWSVMEIDGHNFNQIEAAVNAAHPQKPIAIIANTIKGKGVSFMESENNWHYLNVKADDYEKAKAELCQK